MKEPVVKSVEIRLGWIAGGTAAAALTCSVLHEHFGGPFMFVPVEPPAADPLRNQHVALAWITIYGALGFVGGAITMIGNRRLRHLSLSFIPALAAIILRMLSTMTFFRSEEITYGTPSALAFALIGGCMTLLINRIMKANGE
jgi:hypothetical protein